MVFLSRPRLPLSLLGVLLVGAPSSSQARQAKVLLLAAATEGHRVRSDTFRLALAIQLEPYDLEVQRESWQRPAAAAEQHRRARQRAAAEGCGAVVWFSERREVRLYLVDLQRDPLHLYSITMGRPISGIERAMAAAVRTLLRASPLAVPKEEDASRTSAPPLASAPKTAMLIQPQRRLQPPRWQLDAGYRLDLFPASGEVRHGPEVGLTVRLYRWLQGRLSVAIGLPDTGSDLASRWSRRFFGFGWSTVASWRLGGRWRLSAGLRQALGLVEATAQTLGAARSDQARLWELSLGAVGGAELVLWRWLSLELRGQAAGLPLSHRLSVRGLEVSRTGRLQLSAGLSVQVRLP